MIQFIHKGNPEKIPMRRFACKNCGCVFDASTKECQIEYDYRCDMHYFCHCPFCNDLLKADENKVTETAYWMVMESDDELKTTAYVLEGTEKVN